MGNAFTKKSDEAGGSAAAETFDGGGFVPLGVYPNQPQDYDRKVVRKLIIERKLSPFYKGLADVDDLPPGAIDGEFAADAFAGAAADTAAANGGNKGEPAKQSPSSGAGAADGSPSAGGGGGGAGSTSRSATSTSSAAPHLKRTSFHSRFAVSGLAAGSSSPSSVVGAPLRRSNSCSNTAAPHAAASPVQISPRELYDRPVECPICFLVRITSVVLFCVCSGEKRVRCLCTPSFASVFYSFLLFAHFDGPGTHRCPRAALDTQVFLWILSGSPH
ncbi:MAG: hypothetical protein BJ554DRAFT_1137 [Olpidium bornovanus]|uniref:Uncharacterized protein n=1 Tax=Olpidium bornovanus TaxID=278681 RepID=A0A8H7ZSK1_9FUNG|nr:MAG: hypothetical protein BJ554DRAFT_1137 [Olpidium bornovanus]